MSKSIIRVAKRCRQILEEYYGVDEAIISVRVWPSVDSWELCCYGKCPNGTWVLAVMFDNEKEPISFKYNTKEEVHAHLLRIMSKGE